MDKASEAILALKPVTFRYKKKLDPNRVPQFRLVAEKVKKTAPDLAKRDLDGNLQPIRERKSDEQRITVGADGHGVTR